MRNVILVSAKRKRKLFLFLKTWIRRKTIKTIITENDTTRVVPSKLSRPIDTARVVPATKG